ncbi:D-glycero-beta-D-manno-heptose-7-phosphate kinase [Mycolicibacterium neoaurum]|uniref:D-glycero-beta-D-manno-heptose-7-phosphate kinase n=1 Tax=Mycolicibacterium neoaurum TaxID=1795 RepID=UPI001ABDAFC4|nr:D-glycero-beta-D-manno-heptose-7-phosphate kinase [Mycolicibacterium neoaurum]
MRTLNADPGRHAMDSSIIESLSSRTVVVVGDLMLDRFVYGSIERISPEAPIPVLKSGDEKAMLGGAGNVARNIAALGSNPVLVGAVGHDNEGQQIRETLCPDVGIDARLVVSNQNPTTVKTRYVCEGQQVLRVDREERLLDEQASKEISSTCANALTGADVLILSDYAKGVLTPETIEACIRAAKASGVPVIVDPKSRDFGIYRHADVITPNANEASISTGYDCATDDGVSKAAIDILQRSEVGAVLITRGALGMTLLAPNHGVDEPVHIPTKASQVYDVSGAGDTVIATLALSLAAGIDLVSCVKLANSAAQIVVRKLGTAALSIEELLQAVVDSENSALTTRQRAIALVSQWRSDGLTVGFANGCFDLVHPGHVSLLRQAREECDRLVVALNTDASVKRLKGESRPIQDEFSRADVISSLKSVDLVTLFDEDTPLELIQQLRPDILFKGEDYQVHEVVGGDIARSWGGRVSLIPLKQGHSTTNIIARSEQS